ncbi:NAD(P)H-quinone oxidoreductase [Maritimibacter sp. 55A14]|uniref:NAD(P)H-quinone oxidoreductase n=1 Tax=Maritimibacter sp. 55A14 TaxID=2174844 RepID=UPI000D60CD2F|nr:NAD(P)H-quinone oxidoreductase [Maritimibacter sp. 55A14]PWE32319.1 NAD(P)H-quinone oxidoreductase [Maritimibacter sp. 55A14]
MTLPETMRAVEIRKPGGPEALRPTERPVPRPGPGQVLIRVAYAGVNRPDALQRAGAYDPPPGASDLPGLEAAGEVAAVGPGVTRWAEGDAVTALLPGGGYAEYALTHQDHALRLPEAMTPDRAAALPETFFTVWSNVFMRGRLRAGETFLLHGGTSGIGTTAIQLAHAFGVRVFATAGTAEKCAACTGLGAARAINYRDEDFVAALADDGRLVQIAFLSGPEASLNFAQIMVRRLTVTGSTLRPQSDLAKARITAELERAVWPLLDAGRVAPVMDSEYALEDAAQAHARMESSAHIGKIVLKVG